MRDTQLELVCDWSHPGVILSLKHLFWACQVQVTYRHKERGESEIYIKGRTAQERSDKERRGEEISKEKRL